MKGFRGPKSGGSEGTLVDNGPHLMERRLDSVDPQLPATRGFWDLALSVRKGCVVYISRSSAIFAKVLGVRVAGPLSRQHALEPGLAKIASNNASSRMYVNLIQAPHCPYYRCVYVYTDVYTYIYV